MDLKCETILDFYTHKNKKILCQIKANPKGGKLKNLCRSLSQEHWKMFDKELEKLITTVDDWNNKKCLKFIIKPYIKVMVRRSNLSLKHFYEFFYVNGECDKGVNEELTDFIEANLVLECLFDFQLDVPSTSFTESQEYETSLDSMLYNPILNCPHSPTNGKCEGDQHKTEVILNACGENTGPLKTISEMDEIEPLLKKKINNLKPIPSNETRNNDIPNVDTVISEYEIECGIKTKCKKGKRVPGTIFQTSYLKQREKRSKSEEVSFESLVANTNEKYKVKKKQLENKKKRSRSLDEIPGEQSIDDDNQKLKNEIKDIDEKSYKELDSNDEISLYEEKGLVSEENTKSENIIKAELTKPPKKTSRTPPLGSDNEFEDGIQFEKYILKKSSQNIRDAKETLSRSPPLRRSDRSSSKAKRFMEINRNLFGKLSKLSAEEDCFDNKNETITNESKDNATIFESPVSKSDHLNPPSTSSSIKKKRKREKISSECQQEKINMNKWLSKKQTISIENETKKSSKSSNKPLPFKALPTKVKLKESYGEQKKLSKSVPSTPISSELPSKEELELIRHKTKLMQKENEKVRAELDKMCSSPPKEVEILSLQNIPVDDILNTFLAYKSELDDIYESNRKRDYIKGHDGINHCFVIRLLHPNIQLKMLEKLTEVYSNSKTATQATLFANALLPEWIVRVYMEKFNFTRQQAIDQIKAQEEFQLHMESQNDNTLTFD